jgi:hypothetical protein
MTFHSKESCCLRSFILNILIENFLSTYQFAAIMSSNSKQNEEGDLSSLLSRAIEDIWSQAGRIGADITTVGDVAMTALAGGIVDDQKYVVSMNGIPIFSNLLIVV